MLLLGHTGKPQCWLYRLISSCRPLTMSNVRALNSRCGWLLLLITQMLAAAFDLLLPPSMSNVGAAHLRSRWGRLLPPGRRLGRGLAV